MTYRRFGDGCVTGPVRAMDGAEVEWARVAAFAQRRREILWASVDGALPVGGLVMDKDGNLYGTNGYGGTGDCVLLGTKVGCGTVYEMSPPATKGAVPSHGAGLLLCRNMGS
jgi:hypothetical protein